MVEIARTPEEFEALVAPIVAEMTAKGARRFVPSEWELINETAKDSTLATVQGMGCEYAVVQGAKGFIVTMRPEGPYPYASLVWVQAVITDYVAALRFVTATVQDETQG